MRSSITNNPYTIILEPLGACALLKFDQNQKISLHHVAENASL